jgi:NTP pyrophosphatase (non-canonical NTP hydrolase)
MDFKVLQTRALEIRRQYEKLEQQRYGRTWSNEELMLGLVGDVGDLAKLIQAHNGVRDILSSKDKLAHELADCLWSVMVLAENCQIDLEQAFVQTMDGLETHLKTAVEAS